MNMKWYDFALCALLIFAFAVLLFLCSGMRVSASELDEPEQVQSTRQTETEESDIPADIELDEPEDMQPDDTQEDIQAEPEAEQAETEAIPPEQLEPVETDSQYYITAEPLANELESAELLAQINWTLNAILFCMILSISIAAVYGFCKLIYPLFDPKNIERV